MTDFISLDSKNIADGNCSHKIKRCLLRRKVIRNLGSILKSRDITLPTKVLLVKVTFFFPVAMQACVGWTIKKAENQRTDTLNCGVGENS